MRNVTLFFCAVILPGHAALAEAIDEHSPVLRMLPGVVVPERQVTLSVPLDGTIASLPVREGQVVTAGQLLAAVDFRVAEASARLAELAAGNESPVIQARNQLAAAERFLQRVRQADRDSASSAVEVDQATADVNSAADALRQAEHQQLLAKAQLELEQARLRNHKLFAPFDGRVSRITGAVGQSMARNEPLMRLVDLRQLKAELHVPHEYLGQLSVGDTCTLQGDAPVNRRVTAQLSAFENTIDAGTGTFRCVFLIDNSESSLPAGFTVKLVEPQRSVPPKLAQKRTDR